MLLQQGDVLIEKVDEIPDEVKELERKDGKLVLAEGEATGHAHTIEAPHAKLFETKVDDQKETAMFLLLTSATPVRHQEHKTVNIPAGKWKIRKVKEYDHFMEEAKNVAD